MDKSKVYLEVPEFTGENVPVAVAARVMKKDQQFRFRKQLITASSNCKSLKTCIKAAVPRDCGFFIHVQVDTQCQKNKRFEDNMVCQSGNVHERGNAYIMLFKLGIYFIAIGIVKFIIYFIKKMGIKNAER